MCTNFTNYNKCKPQKYIKFKDREYRMVKYSTYIEVYPTFESKPTVCDANGFIPFTYSNRSYTIPILY